MVSSRTSTNGQGPVPLSELRPGDEGVIRETRLTDEDAELLRAMGLDERSRLKVCRSGEPCIVLAGATRVGLSRAMTRQIMVAPAEA